jgi:hypothetical protein
VQNRRATGNALNMLKKLVVALSPFRQNKGISKYASTQAKLRMLRPRPSARFARCGDLLVRVHVLSIVRGRHAAGPLSQLRRRARQAADPAGREAFKISGIDRA